LSLVGRQTEGSLGSSFELMVIELPVCDHSTVSRRKKQLSISLPIATTPDQTGIIRPHEPDVHQKLMKWL